MLFPVRGPAENIFRRGEIINPAGRQGGKGFRTDDRTIWKPVVIFPVTLRTVIPGGDVQLIGNSRLDRQIAGIQSGGDRPSCIMFFYNGNQTFGNQISP